ncbi:hypothetical protein D6D10_08401 [Aureobasidium pullulans]|uniref:Apple domain-containing protein n=2 Tax=Aureobasidium pullulans TaxID=5580 RepID=A0A4S9EAT1_AURPU|nr:hypothetical protein D6D10_08401 [Aureobasidium pullulans]
MGFARCISIITSLNYLFHHQEQPPLDSSIFNMRSFIAAAAFAALAQAQDLDWDVVLQATPIAEVSIPVVYATVPANTATATTVSYSSEAAAAAVTSALEANPSDAFPLDNNIAKRATVATCQTQPTGAGPVPTPDSASAFLALPDFSASATAAAAATAIPSGYVNTFVNQKASNNAYGYMGYTLLTEYNAQTCADKCTKINGCQAFNIYFERDPTVNPDDSSCSSPSSTTQIKCVYWSGPVTSDNANNAGQWRNQFQVVIAGSNGYVNKSIATPDGYNAGVYLNNAAINAPLDCTGDDTFLESHVFNNKPFDANLCAAACNSQANYARATAQDGKFTKACNFFNTYLLYKNKVNIGQYCALYDQSWASSYAKNTGYYYGQDVYTVGFSYSFSNKTDPGQPRYPCAVASAKSAISSATLQSYCSSILTLAAATTQIVVYTPTVSATTFTTAGALKKRATSATPSALQKYAPSVVTQACGLAVTSGATATTTTTASPTTVYIATSTV